MKKQKNKPAKYWVVLLETPFGNQKQVMGVFTSRKKAKQAVGYKVKRHETSWIDRPGHSEVGISSDRIVSCSIDAFYVDGISKVNWWIREPDKE